MLSSEQEKEGRVRVSTVEEYIEGLNKHRELVARAQRNLEDRDLVLHGFAQSASYTFPYPGPRGEAGPVVKLWRGQATHLVVELLKKLAPDGELPEDKAELGDFISGVIQDGSCP